MAILYIHKRVADNSTFYVGIGKSKKRAYSKRIRNRHWHAIADKGYEVEILFENLSWDEVKQKEIELISHYGRSDLGLGVLVNMTDGGDGLGEVSDDLRKKMSASWTAPSKQHTEKRLEALRKAVTGKPRSEETKAKISKGNKGKVRSEEYIKNLSERMKGKPAWNKGKKGKPLSEEHKQALTKANKGRVVSEETKAKISQANKGRSTRKGTVHSEETKAKMSESAKRREESKRNQK
jgi:hypothetical protein